MNQVLQTDFENALDPNIELVGTCLFDTPNALVGTTSLRMVTDPSEAPYYFWYWHHNLPVQSGVVRLEVTAAINNNVRSFGIGWQIVKNNMLAIMFARINYANNRIELVQNTNPHIWQTVAEPVPLALRSNNPLKIFRYSLDLDVDTLTYKRVCIHDFLSRTLPNEYIYLLNIVNIPTPYQESDSMTIKINPQGTEGVTAAVWLDNIRVFNEV
jgi:hypothetical protein